MNCFDCQGCLIALDIGRKRYLYCTFCRQLYSSFNNKVFKIEDIELNKKARLIHGDQV